MTDDHSQSDCPDSLRQRATLSEYEFNSAAPVFGGLIARLRRAWNGVATKWQARPVMEQQTAFNRALADWLERPPGRDGIDDLFVRGDRAQTAQVREAGSLSLKARRVNAGSSRRPRVAYFSPLPPSRSGIADYSAELLPHLAELVDLTVFAADPASVRWPGLPVKPASEYHLRHAEFDLPLYQMGNSDQHEAIYDLLLRYPGVVVLHDYFLHHFIRHRTVGQGDWGSYAREMGYARGRDGFLSARGLRRGLGDAPLFTEPLNQRLIDASLGLIVHSHYAAERARHHRPDLPLAVVPSLVEPRPGRSLRAQLHLPDDVVLFGSFGQITSEKRIDAALRAFHGLLALFPPARYLLVGDPQPDVDLDDLLAQLGVAHAVLRAGYVDDLDEFVNWIHTVDVVVNLRQPTVGETSAVALRAMAAAKPLIVYDHGWYSEIPDGAALKVPPGDGEALRRAMETLAQSSERRQAMGQAGHAYAVEQCAPARVAATYADFIQAVLEPPNG